MAPTAPLPGRAVRGSATGRPIMAVLDLLGRRWALRVIWELRESPFTFRELQARCGDISSSVLNQRLAELKATDVVETSETGYRLSGQGRQLLELLLPLQGWANAWSAKLEDADAD